MTEKKDMLTIRINPDNRQVLVSDPEYIEAWTNALNKLREEIKAQLRERVKNGELEIPVKTTDSETPVGLGDARQSTPEDALHFWAHTLAEQEMQNWEVMRGIGMFGVSGGYDHGQAIRYVDDPSVPFLDYKISEKKAA